MNKLLLIFAIGLFGCASSNNTGKISNEDSKLESNTANGSQINQLNCTRSQAEPILKKDVYPLATFVLQPDSITGIETLIFDNGDKLIIKNHGCEYYILTFRFETSRFKTANSDLNYWFSAASMLMDEIKSNLNVPINIESGIIKLNDYISKNHSDLKLGEEIDFGTEEIRSFVTVNKIEKLSDEKQAVEISFSVGPL
jgi:hypothetical protein